MKFAVAESCDQVVEVASNYEAVFVLAESFENFDNFISLPAALNGQVPKFRDHYLSQLGKHINVQRLDQLFGSVPRKLQVRPSEVFSIFELNIFSRHPEISDLAKASYVLDFMSEHPNSELISFLKMHPHVNDFFEEMLCNGDFRKHLRWPYEIVSTVRRLVLPLFEFSKGQIWLLALLLRSLRSSFMDSGQYSGRNVFFRPTSSESSNDDEGWGNYWRELSKIEGIFRQRPIAACFQNGFFIDSQGRRIRPFGAGTSFYLSISIEWAVARTLWLRVWTSHRKQYLTHEERAFARGLRDAYWRSMAGPSLVQSLWEHHQFSLFFRQAKPKSVFFLCEGQPWETALVAQGRRMSPNSQYFGVAHTAIRPWDLRYFRPHSWKLGPVLGGPSAPDFLLVTSRFCLERLTNYYHETSKARLVETLRYNSQKSSLAKAKTRVIVVATTYSREENLGLRGFVEELMKDEGLSEIVRIRSHPLRPMKLKIREYDKQYDFPILTICDSTSTVSVELLETGHQFVTMHVGSLPNLSPLADLKEFDGRFVFPSPQLLQKIRRVKMGTAKSGIRYYERDPNWHSWRRLIMETGI